MCISERFDSGKDYELYTLANKTTADYSSYESSQLKSESDSDSDSEGEESEESRGSNYVMWVWMTLSLQKLLKNYMIHNIY